MTTPNIIGVLIVEDNDRLRAAIASFLQLEPDIRVLGEAADGVEAVERSLALQPGVVIMDITMPRMDGFEATQLLRGKMPAARVVMLTQHNDDSYVQRARSVGACGFVTKNTLNEKLASVIRRVSNGEIVFEK